jgi:acyl-CoA thioester hydrolase
MKKEIKPYTRKTAYYETDQMAIIHHSNYIRWFEEARIDFLGQIGLPYNKMEEEGILIPVLSVSCEYKYAMRFGQTFQINMKITRFTGVKFYVQYEVIDPETGRLHAVGESSHCFVTKDMIPIRLKKEYPDIYATIMDYTAEDK